MSFHRLLVSAALAGAVACSASYAGPAEPARTAVAPVFVDGIDVEEVAALGAGVPLNFTLFGTAGALVSLRIEGGRRVLELLEAEPGVYEGRYVIDSVDAIRPESRVTATLQKNGAVAYAALDEPLLLARGTVPWRVAAAPAPDALPAPLATPVPPTAAAAATPVPQAAAVAPLLPRPVATPPQRLPPAAVAHACSDCAVVESVRAVEAAPRGGVIGTIGGAIAGAILGKELGEAHKQHMLTVLGAIGGALAGRQIERHATQSTQYEVDLRLADGTLLRRRYEQAPPFAAGATIHLGTPMRGMPAPSL